MNSKLQRPLWAVTLVTTLVTSLAVGVPANAADLETAAAVQPDFGPNVRIFDPSMTTAQIKAVVDPIAAAQVDDEMGTNRYALLFKPGTYGSAADPLVFQVGYGTEVAGLGALPTDVTINGHVDVYNRCLTPDNCIALNNFWRSISNLTIAVAGGTDCRASAQFWAASQASPMRRVKVTGGTLSLMDYCTAGPQFASGGFIADSMTGDVVNGSQQQYYVRNSSIGAWSNGVWNQVFSGVQGAPADSFPDPPYTTLPTTPVSREKPFLYLTAEGRYAVYVPSAQRASAGVSWANGQTPGRSIPLEKFYVARPSDSARRIDAQLAAGKHLLLTPGVYDINRTLRVNRERTVVLGLGIATLTAVGGVVPLSVGDVKGVVVAAVTIDAGPVNSPVLLRVGRYEPDDDAAARDDGSSATDPTTLHDVFFRIGGPHVGKATTSLVVNSDHVILDDIWAWRADHGEGVGWDINTADYGVIVRGDNVTATGLFVEHYQKYNVIWSGEDGTTVFFQNELPYDPPSQAAWRQGSVLGWAAYKIPNTVQRHTLWGGGVYIFMNVDPTIHATRGFEVPVRPGVQLNHLVTVNLNGGTIDHVVNNTGASTTTPGVPSYVVRFP